MLLLYGYCVGIVASRRIERACYEDLAFRVLTGNQQPDHNRISEFRRRNLDALSDLYVQILRLCQKAGMVSLGHVALDGTKVQGNASKRKAMSQERMLKAEKQLEKEINALMRRAEIQDAQEKDGGRSHCRLCVVLRTANGKEILDSSSQGSSHVLIGGSVGQCHAAHDADLSAREDVLRRHGSFVLCFPVQGVIAADFDVSWIQSHG